MATNGETRPCSSQGAKELSGEASRQDPGTTRGSRKSRTGCSVCKQKRRKCDETRPGCLRCRYHNIECPGYDQGIKWRPVNVPAVVRKQPNDSSSSNSRRTTTQARTTAGGEQPKDRSQQDIGSTIFRLQQPHQQPGPWSLHSSTISPWLDVNVPQAMESGSNVMTSDFVLDNLNVESFPVSQGVPFDLDVFINPPFEQHPWQVDLQHLSYLAYNDDSNGGNLVSNSRDTPSGDGHSIAGSLPDSQLGSARTQADGHDYLPRPFIRSCSPSQEVAQLSTPPQQYALPNDKTGDITRLFEQHTSRSLSISDDPAKNSWLTDIWPLSSIYAPLYHALAAMTCLYGPSNSELSSLGIRHLECASDTLHASIIDGERSEALRADIAKTISLAYLKLWDPQSSGTGLSYLAEARTLVKQAAAQHSDTQVLAEKLKPLSMLIHAVLYLDVMSRFGGSNVFHPGHEGFTELLNLSSLTQPESEQHIESLVGFAPTLFSLLSRLADLVAQVRRGGGKRSSLDQISKATDLRAAFERWTPDVDVDRWSDGRALLTNTIQTTEAYRWAALLLVRQAVPEIPWAQSQADLAHMSLSYLATIQSESSTTVAHTFPLLIAGVEAVDQDNKDWIRAKWRYMSETVNMSHSTRFLEITEEVWQRREKFEQRKGYDSRGQGGPASTQDDAVNQRLANLNTTDYNGRSNHYLNPSQHIHSTSTNFPDSLAFKKGIDPLTRSGLTEYTVRGSLHFLTVMNDWKWELMLG